METIAERGRRLRQAIRDQEREAALEREKNLRWQASTSARVVHPIYGDIVVPNRSNLAAVMCAAEVWGVDWSEIIDAEVRRIE